MKTIIVKNQAEWDALPYKFAELTAVHVYSDPEVPLNIKRTPERAEVCITEKSLVDVSDSATIGYVSDSATIRNVSGSATIRTVSGSATIGYVSGSATIGYVSDSATIGTVSGSATIRTVSGSATIGHVSDSATIGHVSGSATIRNVSGSATIRTVSGSATIRTVSGSATIGYVSGSATIGYVSDSATIGYVSDSATIGKAHDNSMFRLCSDGVKIEAYNAVVIVCQDCKPTIKRHGAGVSVVHTKTMKHTVKSFAEIYGNGTKPLTLYKSVKDDFCDHRTGAIKYEGTVECPDWDPNPGRQCGGGLHLSPTPEMALSYHDGKVLECLAERKDIVVYATDITKVRCRKVTVVGEWKA